MKYDGPHVRALAAWVRMAGTTTHSDNAWKRSAWFGNHYFAIHARDPGLVYEVTRLKVGARTVTEARARKALAEIATQRDAVTNA